MKAVFVVGCILASLAGLVGLIVFLMSLTEVGPASGNDAMAGAALLGSAFVTVLLLAMLHGIMEIRDYLKPAPVQPVQPETGPVPRSKGDAGDQGLMNVPYPV